VVTYFVFAETMIFLRRRASIRAAIAEGKRLLKSTQVLIVETTPELHIAGWKIFTKFQDWKDLSYTDCVSFALMDEMGISCVFTFDSDFRTYGFTVIP
jgi:predicted nucleic acid-binding protein